MCAENFHVIFSTDCSAFQDWQSILAFLSAESVGHKVGSPVHAPPLPQRPHPADLLPALLQGPITRIASGCTEEQEAWLRGTYAKLDQGRNQFRVHVTPDFSVDKV